MIGEIGGGIVGPELEVAKAGKGEQQDRDQHDAHGQKIEPAELIEDQRLKLVEKDAGLIGGDNSDGQEKTDDDHRSEKDRRINDEAQHVSPL